jgi:hypothetical protein
MERCFTRSRLLQDQYNGVLPFGYTEQRLVEPVEAFLNQPWDYSAFRAFATGVEMWKILRITKDTFIWVEDENTAVGNDLADIHAIQRATFTAPSGETHIMVHAELADSASIVAGASSAAFSGMQW